eukprot:GHVQ01016131.1.p1 GENE.GHVQ01016131.1~~GHVQ01016131.1.p1  ORF type:complete len:145 (+),score=8.82 GHVQ01016131.1:516-950(+)
MLSHDFIFVCYSSLAEMEELRQICMSLCTVIGNYGCHTINYQTSVASMMANHDTDRDMISVRTCSYIPTSLRVFTSVQIRHPPSLFLLYIIQHLTQPFFNQPKLTHPLSCVLVNRSRHARVALSFVSLYSRDQLNPQAHHTCFV